ncbi:MAG TPA: response regulator [Thiolinea sp.]|nr:response regulator [Thiolinea sp.]
MAQADHTVGVCLYQLDAREEAVLKRVVTFSGAQGRNYVLADLAAAQLVVASNETAVDLGALNPQGAMLIRIADQDSEQPYDLLMQRPLLVTRVMRTLDEARKLWTDSAAEVKPQPTEPVHLTVVEPVLAATTVVQAPLQQLADSASPPVEGIAAAETSTQAATEPPAVPTTELDAKVPTAPVALNEAVIEAKQHIAAEIPTVAPPVQTAATSVAEPVVAPVQTATPATESPEEQGGEYHHRALVVDDSAAIRKQLELELRQAGIASDFAETGEEALEKVASSTYDLVFLDIIMPGIDGYETCRQMRTRKEMKKTPIIMLSAKTSPLDEVQGVIAGASTYLTKPVKSDQLQKTLKRVAMWLDNFQQARI